MSEEQFTVAACMSLILTISIITNRNKEPWNQGLNKLKPSNIRKKKKERKQRKEEA